MTIFFFKFKKLYLEYIFNPFPNIFGAKKVFFQKLWLCHAQLHKSFLHHAKIQRNVMTQFQENTWTDDRTEARTESISSDPSS